MEVYSNSIGVLTSYNIDLPDALCKLGVNMHVDAEVNLSRFMLVRTKLLCGYRAKLRFISTIHRFIPRGILKSYFKKFDVLHFNSASNFSLKVSRMSERPKVFVLHAAPFPENVYENLVELIDVFVAPSEFTARGEATKLGHKPFVIHHGVNTTLFNTSISTNTARKALRIPSKAKVVLWNDRISPEKDLGTLLEAIPLITKEVPKVYFYIKGRAVDKIYYIRIKNLLEGARKRRNVKVHIGWIPHEKLPILYRAADMFVRTSLHENFGLGFVEAMACGTPVVASNTATASEVVGDVGLLFKPRDPEELTDKVVKLLSDDELAERLAVLGLQRVLKNFTLEIAAKKYLELYLSLTNKR